MGGMAQLYRAKITGVQGFEKLIAIKTILPHLLDEKDFITSFIDEAKLAALLNHHNIVQIYDFGIIEDSYFIAMEYLFGKDLRHILRRSEEVDSPLSLEHALYIASRICSALDYAHKLKDFQGKPLNIIHRDISPQNILVTYEGEVKVVDFGIAKAASQSTVTQHGMIKGKVGYMSPEQAGGGQIDHRSDIFSTGIILYEMVTRKRMFTGDTLQILAKVREAAFEPAEKACGGLPPKVYDILNLALAKEPDRRYQSCGEMLADLEECIFALPRRPTARGLADYMKILFGDAVDAAGGVKEDSARGGPEADSSLGQDLAAAEEAKEEPAGPSEEKGDTKPRKRLAPIAALVAVLVVAAVVFALWPREKSAGPPVKELAQPKVSEPSGAPAPGKADTSAPAKDPSKSSDRFPQAKALQEEAGRLMGKNPEEARSLLLKAVQIDPGSAQIHFELGLAHMKLKDFPKAIESYQKATELNPQLPDAYFNLGYIFAMKKDYPRAEEMYGRVVKLTPPYLDEALTNLGLVQEKQGKTEQGVESMEKALAINPQNSVAKKFLDKHQKKKRCQEGSEGFR